MDQGVIQHMRGRAEQCRRLSDMITNPEARESLRKMADDIEADIRRLQESSGRAGA